MLAKYGNHSTAPWLFLSVAWSRLPKKSNIAFKWKLDWIAMAISRIKEGIR